MALAADPAFTLRSNPPYVSNSSVQQPLTTAITSLRGNCGHGEIKTAHCAGRFEVIKALVAYGADLTKSDSIYGRPLDAALKEKLPLVVEFLKWAGASKEPVEAETVLNPTAQACVDLVNTTLRETVEHSGMGASGAIQAQRHGRALQDCQSLADGERPAPGSHLEGVCAQAVVAQAVKRVQASDKTICRQLADGTSMILRAGGANNSTLVREMTTARRNGCL